MIRRISQRDIKVWRVWSVWVMSAWGISVWGLLGLFSLLGLLDVAQADEFHLLYRGTRAQAMGGAFVAVADDEEAIFYNAAGLAGITQFSWNPLVIDAELSSDFVTDYNELANTLNSSNLTFFNALIGKNYSARAQASSTLVLPHFGVGFLVDQQFAIRLKDVAFPTGIEGGQLTLGVQVAYGWTLVRFRNRKGELRMGVAGKFLYRGGGYQQPNLSELLTLNTGAYINSLTRRGYGYGGDLGFQHVIDFKKSFTLMSGFAWTDIGDIAFSTGASPVKSNMTLGVALRYKKNDMVSTLSYDFAHIIDDADWRKKNHLGFELKLRGLSFYGGVNQAYFTYGVGLDLWLIKVMASSYAEEQGLLVNQDPERRYLVHAALKFEL